MRGDRANAGDSAGKIREYSVLPDDKADRDRKSEIRDKARDIFFRHGYRKTTVEDIGKACGLRKGALYHYFANKEEIFAEVVRSESEKVLEKMRLAIAACEDPRAKIVAMFKTRFRIISELATGGGIGQDLNELLPLAAHARQIYFRKEAEMLEQILRDGQKKGMFKPMKLQWIPLVMISALQGMEMHFAEVQDAPALDKGLDELLDLFFEGLCK